MLQKQYRLPAAARLKSPFSFIAPSFSLKVGNNNLEYSRFGFVIGKSIDKRATVRNRIRRKFRSCIEEMRDEIQAGKDMLFFLKGNILEIPREEMYNEIHGFLSGKHLLQ